ncbi:universal stress protein [Chlorobaculum thiosulfatiphilum]|jgi:nucleotide-binding universal stress UspA family protein|uniref:Universal stress protein n=1 Tax=Chlorobaculum thiosulfatiphilum TaxID=115852 RepID=A0A5C4S4V9_CHLTI|nr:universal stress protein [Chlorobaculum thiosulfatiphilum]TNJ38520.1 universal stress protein [Chlorobaculum thiosulfatiphilum]
MTHRIIHSIAVAIDCSPHSKASLEAAAEMAVRLKAELIGIFVEDIDLLHMAGLPFAEEIRLYSATTGKLDTAQLERLLRLQAQQASEMLRLSAESRTLHHTFRVLRGMVPEQLMLAAPEADMLVLGRSGRSPSCRKGLGSTARAALEGTMNVMLMRPGVTAAEGPLLVLCDGSEASKRALRTALEIAGPKSTLNLLVTDPAPDAVERCKEETNSLLNGRAIEVEYYHLPFTEGKQLATFIKMIDSGLLVIGEGMNLPAETLRELIDNIDYPVLMVRGEKL